MKLRAAAVTCYGWRMQKGFSMAAALAAMLLSNVAVSPARETAPAPDSPDREKAPAASAPEKKSAESPEELEKAFIATLTNATLTGRWCFIREGKMGQDREETYRIKSVERKSPDSDLWTVNASFKYAGLEISLPVPLRVQWAGDTPVMIVDNIGIPGGRKYSARVMIYGDTYSGTWTGGETGGLLHGVITREETPAPASKPEESAGK